MIAFGDAARRKKLAEDLRKVARDLVPPQSVWVSDAARIIEGGARDWPPGPPGEWIDCPEGPPAPGWWWFRIGGASPVAAQVTHVVYALSGTYDWRQWRGISTIKMFTIPITEPPAERADAEKREAPPRSLEQELRAWAADVERHGNESCRWPVTEVMEIVDEWSCRTRGASKGKPCTCHLGACHRDSLGEGWYCQLEEQIASEEYEPGEPDPGDAAEQGIADLVYADAELRRRLDDHVERFERIEERLDRAEKAMADALPNPEERVARLVSAEIEKTSKFFRSGA